LENIFDITLQNHKIFYKILKQTPREQLLKIPEGHKNNIWWNIAHVVVTQQLLVYDFSKLQMRVDEDLVQKFRKGTIPNGEATDEEVDKVAAFLFSTIKWTREDYENGIFKEFQEFTTSTKVTLKTVEDALAFNVFHEGLHLGVILSLQKTILKKE